MCSVTWIAGHDGYVLMCNRDERHARAAEQPLVQVENDGVRVLRPVDGASGGAWIAVNEFGVALSLLNGYREADAGAEAGGAAIVSRGLLLAALSAAPTRADALERLGRFELARFRSFVLLVLEPGAAPLVAEWDRAALVVDDDAAARMPLLSSGHDAAGVKAARMRAFERIVSERGRNADAMLAFHRSHADGPSAYSVCMHRDDAATRSFSLVEVAPQRVRFTWHPAPPCTAAQDRALELARRRGRHGAP